MDKGAVTKSQKKGEKPARKGRWENPISGKQLDNVRKGTHVVSAMIRHLETDAIREQKDNRPLPPAPNSKAKTDGEILSKSSRNR